MQFHDKCDQMFNNVDIKLVVNILCIDLVKESLNVFLSYTV